MNDIDTGVQKLLWKDLVNGKVVKKDAMKNIVKKTTVVKRDAILTPDPDRRFMIIPIQHDDIWELYNKAKTSYWNAEELKLDTDINDWENKLNDDERYYIEHILAFFSQADGIVNENLLVSFEREVQFPEAQYFYRYQGMIENIHAETYAIFIQMYIKDKERQMKLFNAIENIPCVKKKADWALRWIENKNATFGERLLAFACVEGIFFSGSFAAIFWLKKRNLLKGLGQANTLISRDEGLHQTFACLLYRKYIHYEKPSKERAYMIVKEACELEKEFQTEALPVSLIGLNKDLMCRYIEYVTDYLLLMSGLDKVYNAKNPFDFMENISLPTNVSFFEDKNNDYQIGLSEKVFVTDDDF